MRSFANTPALRALLSGWKQHLATLGLAWLVVLAVDTWRTRDFPRGPAPETSLLMVRAADTGTGNEHVDTSLAQWRAAHPGKPIALHFWAEWCAICQLEEPAVAALAADWPVLGIAMQSGNAARVRLVQQQRALPWPTAVDTHGAVSRSWGVRAVPTLVVLDPQGHVRFSTTGYTPEWAMRWRLWWAQVIPRWTLPRG